MPGLFIGDVSSHNNVTDWSAYIRDTPAVWVKATQASGVDAYSNPLFVRQFNGATAAGGLVGAYHFADVRHAPEDDADYFVNVAAPLGAFADGRLLPMLDVENTTGVTWSGSTAPGWIDRFIQRYRARTGQHKIAVYASTSWWKPIMQPDLWADDGVYLVTAAYPGSVDWSKGLNQSGYSHPRLAAWQYTDKAPISGMQNPGDRSRQIAFEQADLVLGGTVTPATTEGDEPMGEWFLLQQNGVESGTGVLLESGTFLGQPLPDAVRKAGAYSNLNDGGVTDEQALGRWQDLVTRRAKMDADLAKAFVQALTAAGITGGTVGGGATPQQVQDAVEAGTRKALAGASLTFPTGS
jgi:GH25 family lysozyme M1 (1,4-beta-N-acetylmuramidase)